MFTQLNWLSQRDYYFTLAYLILDDSVTKEMKKALNSEWFVDKSLYLSRTQMNLAEKICRHPEKVKDENPKSFLAQIIQT